MVSFTLNTGPFFVVEVALVQERPLRKAINNVKNNAPELLA